MSGFFQKIQEKRCLFQRFVTSIVVYKTFWVGCLVTTYDSKEIFKAGVHLNGKVKVFILRCCYTRYSTHETVKPKVNGTLVLLPLYPSVLRITGI